LPDQPQLSIIIPVLNEADCLDRCLARLFAAAGEDGDREVIVCDGGSEDDSLEIAARYPCRIVRSEAGRARQMNIGAGVARGRQLLFLHADSALPENAAERLRGVPGWGFFRVRLDADAAMYRVIETAINLRSRASRVAGGDQALFFDRELFHRLGGFPAIPLMEDIAICKAARRLAKPRIIDTPVRTSSRRWQRNGVLKTVLLMWSLRLAFWLGVNPARLHRIYYPQRG
jgi:rSAM/selenodomain-associated transferase 2